MDTVEVITIDDDNKIISTSTSAIPKLPSGRGGHASVIINNYAYVLGGTDGSKRLKSVCFEDQPKRFRIGMGKCY